MNIKNIAFISLISTAFASNGLAWRGYDVWSGGYDVSDFRYRTGAFPFPIIFHYKNGDLNSEWSEMRITEKKMSIADVPAAVKQALVGINDVEVYEAYCVLKKAECNYFTHTWSMDRMIGNRKTCIKSGIYEPKNLAAVSKQIGINSLVEQVMSFHDKVYLSGNVARFKISDMNKIAEGWFVSCYDPASNANCGNSAINQKKKAIVVHWTFIPENLFNVGISPTLATIVTNWDKENIKMVLKPQFAPTVKNSTPAASQPAPKKSIFRRFGKTQHQYVAPTVKNSTPAASQPAPRKSIFGHFRKK